MPTPTYCIAMIMLFVSALLSRNNDVAAAQPDKIEKIVTQEIQPLMDRCAIPGMAVGIVTKQGDHLYNFGVISKATGKPITPSTLFEIGSISKTFTATLTSLAQITGRLSLSDTAAKHLPALHGSAFDNVTLLHLATHTAGGLPLQVPDDITTNDQLIHYFQNWKPAHAPGTSRLYSNPSIGLLGMITANALAGDFTALMHENLFSKLHMDNTYYDVPNAQIENYAQGYTKTDLPIRLAPGMLAPQTYGIRSTAADMLRFLQANMQMFPLDEKIQHALTATHTGYFQIGPMTQDLIWEQYPNTVPLQDLLDGNSAKIAYQPNLATAITPPSPPRDNVLLNKTGSTNGFAAYIAFLPQKKIAIVLLANKNYPIDARVTAAWKILTQLADAPETK